MADELLWKKPLDEDRLSDEAKKHPHVFDIHGGGLDLQFPHHEDEIAQSCCANGTDEMARYWLHNEMLQVEGKKMSKSLGNFFTVRDLLDQGVPGEVIRFVMLSTHYRKPMDWTEKKAREASRTLKKWRKLVAKIETDVVIPQVVLDTLGEDLNTAGVLTLMHEFAGSGAIAELKASANLLGILTTELGGWEKQDGVILDSWTDLLMAARQTAIQSKDFTEVDRLKSILTDAGVVVQMSKDGIILVSGPEVNLQKLEALK
jgi:cysteinyl-tRNA synthetase